MLARPSVGWLEQRKRVGRGRPVSCAVDPAQLGFFTGLVPKLLSPTPCTVTNWLGSWKSHLPSLGLFQITWVLLGTTNIIYFLC